MAVVLSGRPDRAGARKVFSARKSNRFGAALCYHLLRWPRKARLEKARIHFGFYRQVTPLSNLACRLPVVRAAGGQPLSRVAGPPGLLPIFWSGGGPSFSAIVRR